MIQSYPNSKNDPKIKLKCALCHENISTLEGTYQTTSTLSMVCKDCVKIFPLDDIELIISLFIAFGGYFGKYKKNEHSRKKIINYLNDKMEEFSFDELNMRLLHRALLYGITPEDYIEFLTSILNE